MKGRGTNREPVLHKKPLQLIGRWSEIMLRFYDHTQAAFTQLHAKCLVQGEVSILQGTKLELNPQLFYFKMTTLPIEPQSMQDG